MSASAKPSPARIGLSGVLGVAFIILKLCHVVTWPWIWVLAPFWIGLLLAIVLVLIALLFIFLVDLADRR